MSWISFLVLFSVENGKLQEIEHVTVVIYEIIDYDISIQTGHSTSPILCPLQLAYVGIPIMMQFYIVNNSPITGIVFQLLIVRTVCIFSKCQYFAYLPPAFKTRSNLHKLERSKSHQQLRKNPLTL